MGQPTYLGQPVPIWPVPPNWGASVSLTTRYLTAIRETLDVSEWRGQLRPRCLYGIAYTADRDDIDAATARRALELASASVFGMPIWCMKARTTIDLAPGATLISVDTMFELLNKSLPPYAIVWKDQRTWEVVEWSSINNTGLTLVGTLAGTYAAGEAYVMPLIFGRLARGGASLKTDELANWSVEFEETINGVADQGTMEEPPITYLTANFSASPVPDGPLDVRIQWADGIATVVDPSGYAWDFGEDLTAGGSTTGNGGIGWIAGPDIRAL